MAHKPGKDAVTVSVPATSANLGPGFDCLGLALDLWNRTTFRLGGEGVQVSVAGEGGAGSLPLNASNLIVQSFLRACREAGKAAPPGLALECENAVPLGSGLGSSAGAVVAGLIGANELMGLEFGLMDIIRIANNMEGHADNAAAAVYGGLVIVAADREHLVIRPVEIAPLRVVVVLPEFVLPTAQARAALPHKVALKDAVANIGRSSLVVEALRSGDRDLLAKALFDRLHQPYRLPLIPGAGAALKAAWQHGVPAALSGAGPSLIAFPGEGEESVGEEMRAAFAAVGLASRSWVLGVSKSGVRVEQA